MEVKIGVVQVPRELVVDTPMAADELMDALAAALADEHGMLTVTDDSGGKVLVPAARIGYVQLGGNESRRIGFSSP